MKTNKHGSSFYHLNFPLIDVDEQGVISDHKTKVEELGKGIQEFNNLRRRILLSFACLVLVVLTTTVVANHKLSTIRTIYATQGSKLRFTLVTSLRRRRLSLADSFSDPKTVVFKEEDPSLEQLPEFLPSHLMQPTDSSKLGAQQPQLSLEPPISSQSSKIYLDLPLIPLPAEEVESQQSFSQLPPQSSIPSVTEEINDHQRSFDVDQRSYQIQTPTEEIEGDQLSLSQTSSENVLTEQRSFQPPVEGFTGEAATLNDATFLSTANIQEEGMQQSQMQQLPKHAIDDERFPMPPSFQNLADFPAEYQIGDIPVFLNIPKSGGTVINDILAGCFHIVCANEVGGQFGHAEDDALQVFEKHGAKYVNIDTSSLKGIAKAKNLNLANSGMVDAIIAWFVYETSELFSPEHRGKFFTVMRHPIERAAVLISNLQNNKEAATYDPSFASMTIEDFVQAGKVDNNWMTRWLSNKREGALTDENLYLAKEVLRKKFVIGLFSELEESMVHFEKYFRWQVINRTHREKCVNMFIAEGKKMKPDERIPSKGSKAYDALLDLNHMDMELYRYAQKLFQEQSDFFQNIPRPIMGILE